MGKLKNSWITKSLAWILCIAMAASMFPASVFTAFALETGSSAAYGQVEVISGTGTVTDDETAAVKVSLSAAALDWSPADMAIGRPKDGWWAGIKVTAPVGATITAEDDVAYQYKAGDKDWSDDQSFWRDKDSADDAEQHYITLWTYVSPETLNDAIAAGTDLQTRWKFDWDRDADFEQTVTLTLKPDSITLKKENAVVYPSAASGKVDTITNGLQVEDSVQNVTAVKLAQKTTLAWSQADASIGRTVDGWWAGIKITAPDGVAIAENDDVPYQSKSGDKDWTANRSFWQDKDSQDDAGQHYMTVWALVNEEKLAAGQPLVTQLRFDWDKDGVFEQLVVLTLDPALIELDYQNRYALDTQAPAFVGDIQTTPSSGTSVEKVTVSGTVRDEQADGYASGIKAVYYQKDGADKQSATLGANGAFSFFFTEEADSGKYRVWCEDNAGKASSEKQVDVCIDKTKPEMTDLKADPNDWTNGAVKITVEASDPGANASGIKAVYYQKKDTDEEPTAVFSKSETFLFSFDKQEDTGEYAVWCEDNAGNASEPQSVTVEIDTENCVVLTGSAAPDTWTNGQDVANNEVVISGTVSDNLSGVEKVFYKGPDGQEHEITNFATTDGGLTGAYSFAVSALDEKNNGTYSIYCKDRAENIAADMTVTVQIDTTLPTLTAKASTDKWTNEAVTITGAVSDKLSGVEKVFYKQGENGEEKSDAAYTTTDKGLTGGYSFTIPAQDYEGVYYVWCKDKAGNKSEPQRVEVKMDTTPPSNPQIKYDSPALATVLETITFGFFKATVTATITAEDNAALASIAYTLDGTESQTSQTPVKREETVPVNPNGSVKTGSIPVKIDPAFKGTLTATACDEAGNESGQTDTAKDSQGTELGGVIVDDIAPQVSIAYAAKDEKTQRRLVDGNLDDLGTDADFASAAGAYYNGAVTATISIEDANFFEGEKTADGETVHAVGVLLTKTDNDGVVTKTEYLPQDSQQTYPGAARKDIAWNTEGDKHTFAIDYTEDADYVLTVKYADLSTNKANIQSDDRSETLTETYTSKPITVDTTAPVVDVAFDYTADDVQNTVEGRDYLQKPTTATITVVEHNFRADDVQVQVTAKDVTGKNVAAFTYDKDGLVQKYAAQGKSREEWAKLTPYTEGWYREGNTYKLDVVFAEDANYTFDIDYTDLAQNPAVYKAGEETVADYPAKLFTVDTVKPDVTIAYNWDDSIVTKVLKALTFGIYKADATATVTVTATDATAGVENFTLSAKKDGSEAATTIELPDELVIAAEGEDIPDTQGGITNIQRLESEAGVWSISFDVPPQFRGQFQATATDRSHNTYDADPKTENIDKYSDNNAVITDTVSPQVSIAYATKDEKTQRRLVDGNLDDLGADADFASAAGAYYNGAVTATISIEDANFFEGEKTADGKIVHAVGVLLTKTDNDGVVTKTEYLPQDSQQTYPGAARKDIAWNTEGDKHTFAIDYTEDADYVLTVKYADLSAKAANIQSEDRSETSTETYTSKPITVDTTAPVVDVAFDYTADDVKNTIEGRDYLQKPTTATITVVEHNFRADDVQVQVTAKDVTGKNVAAFTYDKDGLVQKYAAQGKSREEWAKLTPYTEGWYREGNTYKLDVVFAEDANYTFDIDYTDLAQNSAVYKAGEETVADYPAKLFTVDTHQPENLTISYSTGVLDTFLDAISFGFYNAPVTVTISAKDDTAGIWHFIYNNANYENVSPVSARMVKEAIENATVTHEGATATAIFTIPKDALKGDNQFDGIVAFTAQDRSNWSNDAADKRRIVVDNISPEVSVSYAANNAAVRYTNASLKDVSSFAEATRAYFGGNVTATVSIKEANFFEGRTYTDEEGHVTGIVHEVGIRLTKTDNNGVVTQTEYLPQGAEQKYADATPEAIVWTTKGDVHTVAIPYTDNADYVLTVEYTDFSTNAANITTEDGQKQTRSYTFKTVTVDKTAPVVQVAYSNHDVQNTINGRKYLNKQQSATITVIEHNFRADDVKAAVTAQNVTGADVAVENFAATLANRASWTHFDAKGNEVAADSDKAYRHVASITYAVDANYTFDIDYTDLARHRSADYTADQFTVDTHKPKNLTVAYSTNVFERVLESITFGFYNAQMTVTISAEDETAGIWHFMYSYVNSEGVSSVNAQLLDEAIRNANITHEGAKATTSFKIPKYVLKSDNQFNGTVKFTAYDRSEWSTAAADTRRIVVDNIAPTATIRYNAPVQTVNDVSYYDGAITATLVINEANFYSEDVAVAVTKNEAAFPVTVRWDDNGGDVHTGTFTLDGDGNYVVRVNYADRSSNQMTVLTGEQGASTTSEHAYVSRQLTIDTQAPVIRVENIKNQSAHNEDTISLAISVKDRNIAQNGFKPKLEAVFKKDAGENPYETKEIDLGAAAKSEDHDDTVFTYTVENLETDGYYSLTCEAVDYANHRVNEINAENEQGGTSAEKTVTFSVNREGSVFWIETDPADLNGKCVNGQVTVKLHEVNVDQVDSQKTVLTLNDGSQSKDIPLTEKTATKPGNYIKNDLLGSGGWYENIYTLDNDNFDHDGVYSLNIITYDTAKNSNVNTKDEAGVISFTVDRTAPVIAANIKTDQKVRDTKFTVEFKITETNLNPETVNVKLDGKDVTYNSIGNKDNNEYTFTVGTGLNQSIEISAEDNAGNRSKLYKVERFTVSTNILVLWYANTPLFWGSIAGVLVVAAGLIVFILLKKRKKQQEEE